MTSPRPLARSLFGVRRCRPAPGAWTAASDGPAVKARRGNRIRIKPTRVQVRPVTLSVPGAAPDRDLWQQGACAISAYLEQDDSLGIEAVARHLAVRRRWWIGFEQALPRVRAEVALRASRGRGERPSASQVRSWCEKGLRAWLEDPNTRRLPAPDGRCPGFAQLPFGARDAFFRVFVECGHPDRVAGDLGVSLSTLGRHVRAVLDHLAPPNEHAPKALLPPPRPSSS